MLFWNNKRQLTNIFLKKTALAQDSTQDFETSYGIQFSGSLLPKKCYQDTNNPQKLNQFETKLQLTGNIDYTSENQKHYTSKSEKPDAKMKVSARESSEPPFATQDEYN